MDKRTNRITVERKSMNLIIRCIQ